MATMSRLAFFIWNNYAKSDLQLGQILFNLML